MQANEEENIDEAVQVGSNDRVEVMRTELRAATLTKRKEDRVFAWSKNRIDLGECPGDERFSTEYIDERAKLLKKKLIVLADYRYLPNALIQVRFTKHSFCNMQFCL